MLFWLWTNNWIYIFCLHVKQDIEISLLMVFGFQPAFVQRQVYIPVMRVPINDTCMCKLLILILFVYSYLTC